MSVRLGPTPEVLAEKASAPVGVEDAAQILGVSAASVRNWIARGLIEATDGTPLAVSLASLRRARVLRDDQLLALREVREAGLGGEDLAYAITDGALKASAAPDRRWSLEDGHALVSWANDDAFDADPQDRADAEGMAPLVEMGTVDATGAAAFAVEREDHGEDAIVAPINTRPPPVATANAEAASAVVDAAPPYSAAGASNALLAYLDHGDPWLLPATFFDTEVCPPFIAPRDVGRYVHGQAWRASDGAWWTPVYRSAGLLTVGTVGAVGSHLWMWDDRQLLTSLPGARPVGSAPPEFGAQNALYELAEREWVAAWRARRRDGASPVHAPLVGPEDEHAGARDIVALLARARREDWAPDRWPDWAFMLLLPQDPWPRNDVFDYRFGFSRRDAWGRWVTDVVRSAGFTSRAGADPVAEPAAIIGAMLGVYPYGMPVPQYARENLAAMLAARQWAREHDLRAARRQARGYALPE